MTTNELDTYPELREVSREWFAGYINTAANLEAIPVQGYSICAMQYWLEDKLMAQAIYSQPSKPSLNPLIKNAKVVVTYYLREM